MPRPSFLHVYKDFFYHGGKLGKRQDVQRRVGTSFEGEVRHSILKGNSISSRSTQLKSFRKSLKLTRLTSSLPHRDCREIFRPNQLPQKRAETRLEETQTCDLPASNTSACRFHSELQVSCSCGLSPVLGGLLKQLSLSHFCSCQRLLTHIL